MTYDWKKMLSTSRLERGEWWEKAWTLTAGCAKVSQGCRHCWAASMSHTRRNHPNEAVRRQYGHTTSHGDWDGTASPLRQNLDVPLRRKQPTVYTIWNDLFHGDVPEPFIESAWAVMARCPQHLFIILTKRPARAARAFRTYLRACSIRAILDNLDVSQPAPQLPAWPLPNVVIGTSIEDQDTADARIPALLQCEAAARIVSAEPLLGPVELWMLYCLDGVIVGGESGSHARPMDPAWVSYLCDQCDVFGVPFFFKQWGEWMEHDEMLDSDSLEMGRDSDHYVVCGGRLDGQEFACHDAHFDLLRVGKRRAGRLLSGRTWDELPTIGRAKQ